MSVVLRLICTGLGVNKQGNGVIDELLYMYVQFITSVCTNSDSSLSVLFALLMEFDYTCKCFCMQNSIHSYY